MPRRCPHSTIWLAVAVLVAILAPAVSPSTLQLTVADERCDDPARERCAGLWSSLCCDFVVPRAKDAPERSTTSRVVRLAADPPATSGRLLPAAPLARARAPAGANAVPLLSSHLSTTVLLL